MMRLVLFFTGCLMTMQAMAIDLSEHSQIRVMTMGPDQRELYSAFGHSGIRVIDPVNKVDWVYNWGVFDFDQPNFYLNFTRGKLLYRLGKGDYTRTRQYYEYYNRTIKEQVLNLTLEEKQLLVDFLENNFLPENREYYYNYIYDNCATKIRDVLEAVFPGQITFNEDYATEDLSYRDLMDMYLLEQPWGDVGIDICLGVQIDEIAPARGYMYLPDYIYEGLEGATISSGSSTKPLVADSIEVFRSAAAPNASLPIQPIWFFAVLFLIAGILTHRELKYGLWARWLDVLLFTIVGFVGWVLLFLWLGTDHLSLYNFNLLWAIPFHFPIGIILLKRPMASKFRKYFMIVAVIQVALILTWGLLPQALNMAFVPVVLLLALRSFVIYLRLGKS
ncbi:MAG: DUF4105 domain-containing protein [Cyclobacteriaceae bacterium]